MQVTNILQEITMAKQIDNQGNARGNVDQHPAKVTIQRDYVNQKHSGKVEDSGNQHRIETGPKSNFKTSK